MNGRVLTNVDSRKLLCDPYFADEFPSQMRTAFIRSAKRFPTNLFSSRYDSKNRRSYVRSRALSICSAPLKYESTASVELRNAGVEADSRVPVAFHTRKRVYVTRLERGLAVTAALNVDWPLFSEARFPV